MYSLTFFSKHYSVLARVMYYCKCTLAFICTFTVCNSTYHSIDLFKTNNVSVLYLSVVFNVYSISRKR